MTNKGCFEGDLCDNVWVATNKRTHAVGLGWGGPGDTEGGVVGAGHEDEVCGATQGIRRVREMIEVGPLYNGGLHLDIKIINANGESRRPGNSLRSSRHPHTRNRLPLSKSAGGGQQPPSVIVRKGAGMRLNLHPNRTQWGHKIVTVWQPDEICGGDRASAKPGSSGRGKWERGQTYERRRRWRETRRSGPPVGRALSGPQSGDKAGGRGCAQRRPTDPCDRAA